ncbi:MAG: bifunctional D-glycero-beta-D-manno-heptose-7-phosphate kinase/D-glycero-beta-D-manno-heptose 1-phosphate adenylyltransferase HldE [gamma proteobacterium symbiont of Bathyaustriella thionipta]|nr:bifunctional D-glycero-beta-D-manno-heptose-7-phosphate kinase/D-glycero-beta-D-manno-heptose 1-phosphate adenylyltransferase HldE [gamma proteobacterium symbiont of Bathyaustriella thionipta]
MSIKIPDFSAARVLVVGDLMLDRYWSGSSSRISPEAPVPVVHVSERDERPGGAANVALNMAVLGGQISLLGVLGDDEAAHVLEKTLLQAGVHCHFIRQSDTATITKLRVLSQHQQLLRLDFEQPVSQGAVDTLHDRFQTILHTADVVVFSDYAKGTLRDIAKLIAIARAQGKIVLLDPKHSDFSRYHGASLLTPNVAEFNVAHGHHCESKAALVSAATAMIRRYAFEHILITCGEQGMLLIDAGGQAQEIAAHAREVFDITGAGDTVISTLALCRAVGLPVAQAMLLANHAAAVVVAKLGTASVSRDELQQSVHAQHATRQGVLDESSLLSEVALARARGERITMTNGCFDLLHIGHITYLQEAARLGDRLIVAVNTDATVSALKGADRPVNKLQQRMSLLAALGCVDWVVAFSEATPERLIAAIQPHVLVKGGDNHAQNIPGADSVRAAGGEVQVLSYVEGFSSSAMLSHIRDRQ